MAGFPADDTLQGCPSGAKSQTKGWTRRDFSFLGGFVKSLPTDATKQDSVLSDPCDLHQSFILPQ